MTDEPTPDQAIALGCDHAGLGVKERLKRWLQMQGYSVTDYGTNSEEGVDYPDFAQKVARAVADGTRRRGILVCGTGLGMSYAANRFRGVRAAVCWSAEVATFARTHNDANILILPGRVATMDPLEEILGAWLETPFSEEDRHRRRIAKIDCNET